MWLERRWPRWLCTLTGHQPIEHGRPTHAEKRCLCGASVVSREFWLMRRYQSSVVLLNEWLVARLWRVLP